MTSGFWTTSSSAFHRTCLSTESGKYLQGSAKRLRPGLVNMRRTNCVLLPAAGRRTQFVLLIFTKPGRSLLAEPCRPFNRFCVCLGKRGQIVQIREGADEIPIDCVFHDKGPTDLTKGAESPVHLLVRKSYMDGPPYAKADGA